MRSSPSARRSSTPPTTRGLFDTTSGVYWAVDFATLLPGHVTDADDVPYEMWRDSFAFFGQCVSGWVQWTDPSKFVRTVDEIARLDVTAIAGGHTARLGGERMREAIAMLRELPNVPMIPLPGQADLGAMLIAGTHGSEPVAGHDAELVLAGT